LPALTRSGLVEEFLKHGFQYLRQEPGRPELIVQGAMEEVVHAHLWPFRETTDSFVDGDEVVGLGRIQQVYDTEGELLPISRDKVIARWGIDYEGEPMNYYVERGETMRLAPIGSGSYFVTHFSRCCWIDAEGNRHIEATANSNVPVVPSEFLDVVLLVARRKAKEDVDNEEAVAALEGRIASRMDDMRATLIHQVVDEPMYVRQTQEQV
jgi:hypothetical protein